MINKRRVQRIRGFLYTCILLVIFVPVILMLIVSFKTLTVLGKIEEHFQAPAPVIEQQIQEPGSAGEPGAGAVSGVSVPGANRTDVSSTVSAPESGESSVSSDDLSEADKPKDETLQPQEEQPEQPAAPSTTDAPTGNSEPQLPSTPGGTGASTQQPTSPTPYLDTVPNTGTPSA